MFATLQETFGIPNALSILPGSNDLPKVVLCHRSGARAEVYLHGAQVTSWTDPGGNELFFVSRESSFEAGCAIRGGIPVVFPQFGGGTLPQHGFARTSEWQLFRTELGEDDVVTAAFRLDDSPETRALWPHPFHLELGVQLDENALTIALAVRNTGRAPFDFHAVLHTYFAVADIRQSAVYGLAGVSYIDALRENIREVEMHTALRFAGETDRIYLQAPGALRLDDEGHGRSIRLSTVNMPDVVVWNPWIEKSRRMRDFGDDEYLRMVCVETGKMAAAYTLAGGEEWQGETLLFRVPNQ